MSDLANKLTLVSGSTKGIGRAVATNDPLLHDKNLPCFAFPGNGRINQGYTGNSQFSATRPYLDRRRRKVFRRPCSRGRQAPQELIDNYFAEHEPTSLIQRFVDVKEVAHAVLFLALNGSVNGSAQRVEGGIVRSI